jgi:DNA-binding PadR family transcriptional regulator
MTATKLSEAQERALLALADAAEKYGPEAYTLPWGTQSTTIDVLYRQGFVEKQERPTVTVARITERGREMLASRGD